MKKYLHTFESFNSLDMPVNPSFTSYNEFKAYMNIPEVADLVNRLNDLWWDMEKDPDKSDENMNVYGAQLNELEDNIRDIINEYTQSSNADELDDDINYLLNEFTELLDESVKSFAIISSEFNKETRNLKIILELNGEEYNVKINVDKADVILEDAGFEKYMGNIYDSPQKIKDNFTKMMSSYGEEYTNFLKNS